MVLRGGSFNLSAKIELAFDLITRLCAGSTVPAPVASGRIRRGQGQERRSTPRNISKKIKKLVHASAKD